MSSTLNIINLADGTDHAEHRRHHIQHQLEEQGIVHHRFWPGITGLPYAYLNINRAHKQIVKWAQERNLEEVCIGEDDLYFLGKGAFDFFLKNKPAYYDLYFGGISQILHQEGKAIKDFTGLTLYFVHQRFYQR